MTTDTTIVPARAKPIDERIVQFLDILDAMGGMSDASEYAGNWLNAFCEEREKRSPDTFNMAADMGYTVVSHDSDTDVSKVWLTEKGRAIAARRIEPASRAEKTSALVDQLGKELGGAYDCTRVWSAWSIGTMAEEDFVPVGDRIDEIAEGIMTTLYGPED